MMYVVRTPLPAQVSLCVYNVPGVYLCAYACVESE